LKGIRKKSQPEGWLLHPLGGSDIRIVWRIRPNFFIGRVGVDQHLFIELKREMLPRQLFWNERCAKPRVPPNRQFLRRLDNKDRRISQIT
jgi:hypothetical protein